MESWQNIIIDKLEQILIQTTKTNGRVDALEKDIEDHGEIIERLNAESNETKGKNKIIWIVLSVVGAVSLLLIGYYLNHS